MTRRSFTDTLRDIRAGEVIDQLDEQREAREICGDGELTADDVTEVKSLEQLKRLDGEWDGMCLPYNGDGNTLLKDLLPETEPFKDTKTAGMFA